MFKLLYYELGSPVELQIQNADSLTTPLSLEIQPNTWLNIQKSVFCWKVIYWAEFCYMLVHVGICCFAHYNTQIVETNLNPR